MALILAAPAVPTDSDSAADVPDRYWLTIDHGGEQLRVAARIVHGHGGGRLKFLFDGPRSFDIQKPDTGDETAQGVA